MCETIRLNAVVFLQDMQKILIALGSDSFFQWDVVIRWTGTVVSSALFSCSCAQQTASPSLLELLPACRSPRRSPDWSNRLWTPLPSGPRCGPEVSQTPNDRAPHHEGEPQPAMWRDGKVGDHEIRRMQDGGWRNRQTFMDVETVPAHTNLTGDHYEHNGQTFIYAELMCMYDNMRQYLACYVKEKNNVPQRWCGDKSKDTQVNGGDWTQWLSGYKLPWVSHMHTRIVQ